MNNDPRPWPLPPIWAKDLANIRALLTDEEWTDLQRRLVHRPGDRLVAWNGILPISERNQDTQSLVIPTTDTYGSSGGRRPGTQYFGMANPRVSPRYPRLTAALRRALRSNPSSLLRLAQEAGVQPRSLLRISRGDLGASPALVQRVARTLLRWGDRCTRAADELRRALRESR